MNQPVRLSYLIMTVLLVLIGFLHLGTLVLTTLFGYFALELFSFRKSKLLGLAIYIIVVAAIGTGLVYFSRQAYVTLPVIADKSIPAAVEFAQKNGVELPFTDYESLRTVALSEAREGIAEIGRYIRTAAFQVVLLIAGLVVAASMFLDPKWSSKKSAGTERDDIYSAVVRELTIRFKTFFDSFSTVIGAQLVISTINTGLTAIFLLGNHYSFIAVLVALTFLCGLLPIVGNLISNALIVAAGFTVSPKTTLFALIFLVVIHKLEYFLNSKIIGDRTKNPVWLTLLGLVLGEKLMGIPGMILAPVVLHYIKTEASRNKIPAASETAVPAI